MPQVVNFDVLTCDTVEVRKTVAGVPREWHLRDDVSAETMIRFFELARAEAATEAEAREAGTAAVGVVESFHAADRVYTAVLVDVFRHTYPDKSAADTEAELRVAFSFEQRKQLVDLFFSLAGIGSSGLLSVAPDSTPTPDTSIPPSTMEPAAVTTAPPNRAARRARKKSD